MAPALAPGAITDLAGLAVGHAQVDGRPSGCTVLLCPEGAVCGVDVRGGAPGTRETDLLQPGSLVQQVHALLLTGGSAFGLDAASGVMRWLDERGHGLPVGPVRREEDGSSRPQVRVPIVPAAVLFDLGLGDPRLRPNADTGYAACVAAGRNAPAQGNVGAGAGATVGKLFGPARAMKGGIGTASLRLGAVTVGALVAVNAFGDVLDEHGRVLAGALDASGQRPVGSLQALLNGQAPLAATAGLATTIGIVATDAVLDKARARQLATLAHHGLSRAVSPVTLHDGDTLFALATGGSGCSPDASAFSSLGALAAEVVSRAIRNAVLAAQPLPAYGLRAATELSRN
jgi:L-aminopeptidase/D-esterase-like protein